MWIRRGPWCTQFASIVATLGLMIFASAATMADTATTATPDAAWDAIFQRTEGWTGGDAMYSVDLKNGQVLWLFADTWVGKAENGGHAAGSRLVNNTLALHSRSKDGAPPAADAIRFLWGAKPKSNEPAAWIRPEDVAAADSSGSNGRHTWYWVADGAVARGPNEKPRLVVFLWRISKTGAAVMDFRAVGGYLAIVDNPHEDWSNWKPRQVQIAHSIPSEPKDSRRRPEIAWGSEVLVDKDAAKRDLLLIYGYRQAPPGQTQLVLARAPAGAVETMDRWEFRSRDGWSSRLADAAALADGLTTEFSVTPIELAGRVSWVLIHSEPLFGTRIFARTSATPYGPWSTATPLYEVPQLERGKKHFAYAGKAHPESSRPGELLVTYIVNSMDFGEILDNANIYRPRFIRVPLSLLPPPD
jgi:hypothetical protein